MNDVSTLTIGAAFAAGVVSFLSPCVLPLVPGYVSYLAAQSSARHHHSRFSARLPVLMLSFFFVAGFSSIFVALGASATMLGRLLLAYRHEATMIGGVIIILFGLIMMGLLPLRVLQRDFRFHAHITGASPLTAYIVGLAFGFGWTPCIGPVLGAILTMSAISASASAGVVLLAIYSLGLGVPFLISAVFTDRLVTRHREVKRIGRFLYIFSGAVMILTGIAVVTDHLSTLAIWLLERFPSLGTIG